MYETSCRSVWRPPSGAAACRQRCRTSSLRSRLCTRGRHQCQPAPRKAPPPVNTCLFPQLCYVCPEPVLANTLAAVQDGAKNPYPHLCLQLDVRPLSELALVCDIPRLHRLQREKEERRKKKEITPFCRRHCSFCVCPEPVLANRRKCRHKQETPVLHCSNKHKKQKAVDLFFLTWVQITSINGCNPTAL
jgi:hypothetical protein